MSDHYYSKNPQSNQKTQTWEFTLRNHPFTFMSSTGVFSKGSVDYGSQLLIETFSMPDVTGKLLDLGCGYGPIGIAIAQEFPEKEIVMVDVNERAVALAKENARRNNVRNVDIRQSDGFSNVLESEFSVILTNPPIRAGKKVIYAFFKESINRLVPEGELWVVIQKKQGAPSVIKYLSTLCKAVEVIDREKGYYIIRAKKTK